jgi:hypothetical protein
MLVITTLGEQLRGKLLPGMSIPEPFELLFGWIEDKGLFIDTDDGRLGFLFSRDKIAAEQSETARPGGTDIRFLAEGNAGLEYWFGHECSEILNRLCVFARTGWDGSMAAFWLDDAGKLSIVHLGSGPGSTLVCVLAEDSIDFLRLLAIGYDEICWSEEFPNPPNSAGADVGPYIEPNIEYQNWVRQTFSVTIPPTAAEIVRHPSRIDDDGSEDPFHQWVRENTG